MRNVEKRCSSAYRTEPGNNTKACYGKEKSRCSGRFTDLISIIFFSVPTGPSSTPSSAIFSLGEDLDEMCCVVRAVFVGRHRAGCGPRKPKTTAPLHDHDSTRPHCYLGRRFLRVHDPSDPSAQRAIRCRRSQEGESLASSVCPACGPGRGTGLA